MPRFSNPFMALPFMTIWSDKWDQLPPSFLRLWILSSFSCIFLTALVILYLQDQVILYRPWNYRSTLWSCWTICWFSYLWRQTSTSDISMNEDTRNSKVDLWLLITDYRLPITEFILDGGLNAKESSTITDNFGILLERHVWTYHHVVSS